MTKLISCVGNPAIGPERFWGREKEIALLAEHLREGKHVLLVAQRRIGKTSLVRELERRKEGQDIFLYVDLQQACNPAEFIAELSAATRDYTDLWQKIKVFATNIIQGIGERIDSVAISEVKVILKDGMTNVDWRKKGDELFTILGSTNRPIIIVLDELPILVNRLLRNGEGRISQKGISNADGFMSWLRYQCTDDANVNIRIVLTGSIGIEYILGQVGLSATINYLAPFELRPWSYDTAIGCLKALAAEKEIIYEDGACELIVELLKCCIPHHVQLFFSHLYDDSKYRECSRISLLDVERVYSESMLSPRGHAELSHYIERLKLSLDAISNALACDLLSETAVAGVLIREAAVFLSNQHLDESKRPDENLHDVLTILEHDGYLEPSSKRSYIFTSNLLRDWWRVRYTASYVPFSERKGS